jgi:hypothetical protein
VTTVTIDGIDYVPATSSSPRIGVAITTRNRRDLYTATLAAWRRHLPDGATLVIVDDASDIPAPGATYRFEQRAGIARAKNKCLELLDDAGVDHFFLSDDDTIPLTCDWWRPYVDSPEPHLMHIWPDSSGPATIATDSVHTAYTDPRGNLLYCDRSVLSTVGGMDPCYGTWGHEHLDWSTRIHNAHLTTWRYMDVTGSDRLLHCADQEGITRSVDAAERRAQLARNLDLYAQRVDSTAHIDYRTRRNVVLTCWIRQPDRQRRGRVNATPLTEVTARLAASITGADLVVLSSDPGAENPIPDTGLEFYLARWVAEWQWLRDHPDTGWVFLVDAGDVTMQNPPWEHMQPGRLYLGWEPKLVADPWMTEHHQSATMRAFLAEHSRSMLLNCGIVGGDRATVMALCHDMIHAIQAHMVAIHERTETRDIGTDMGLLNLVAYTRHADRIITGPEVATVFKTPDAANTWSFWRHK